MLLYVRFYIGAVEETISALVPKFKDADLGTLFANCLPNTVSHRYVLIMMILIVSLLRSIFALSMWRLIETRGERFVCLRA